MKKTILLTAALSLVILAHSQKMEYPYLQYNTFWGYVGFAYNSKENKENLSKSGVNSYTQTSNKGKKEFLSMKMVYDKNGNTTSCVYYKKSGEISTEYDFSYNEKNMVLSQICENGKGKEKSKLLTVYDVLGNIIEEDYYSKGKPGSKTISTYDSTRIQQCLYYKKDFNAYWKKWEYSYYPDHSKKSSVIYDSKGKKLYAWNYECKPEGELVSKHKDTTDVCKKVEFDENGNKTVTTRRFDEKGKAIKFVIVYDKSDKILQYLSYNSKDQLTYSYKYNKDGKNVTEVVNYKNGNETYKYDYTYDSNNNLLSSVGYKKGKQINRSELKYNEQNLVVTQVWYGKSDKHSETRKYEYRYF